MPVSSIIAGFIGRIAGDLFLKVVKKFWNNSLNNPSSKLYYGTLIKAVKYFWLMFKTIIVVKLILLLFKIGMGRTISKDMMFKLTALLVLVIMAIAIASIWQRMERKKREAEPVLF